MLQLLGYEKYMAPAKEARKSGQERHKKRRTKSEWNSDKSERARGSKKDGERGGEKSKKEGRARKRPRERESERAKETERDAEMVAGRWWGVENAKRRKEKENGKRKWIPCAFPNLPSKKLALHTVQQTKVKHAENKFKKKPNEQQNEEEKLLREQKKNTNKNKKKEKKAKQRNKDCFRMLKYVLFGTHSFVSQFCLSSQFAHFNVVFFPSASQFVVVRFWLAFKIKKIP